MSCTKFESLPNEILIKLFEEYINGIDIINGFAFQLNNRIDSLILNCKRFRFDFVECHKDEFRFTMGLLPVYIDRIEELALSEHKTPGQIYAFLNYICTFENFTKLRRLYIDAILPGVVKSMLLTALDSLPKISVDTLSILFKDDSSIEDERGFYHHYRRPLESIKTLKKLSAPVDMETLFYNSLPNLRSLTLTGVCNRTLFDIVLNNAIHLKYFNVKANFNQSSYSRFELKQPTPSVIPLETLIIKMENNGRDQLKMFDESFPKMQMLRRLEFTGNEAFADSNAWQQIVNESLKSLNYFRLTIDSSLIKPEKCLAILDEFQQPFWCEKNFQLIIRAADQMEKCLAANHPRKLLLQQCWNGPRRDNTTEIIQNPAKTLAIEASCQSFLPFYQFTQLNQLIIEDLTPDLTEMINRYVPKSRIDKLTINCHPDQHQNVGLLLSLLPNLKKLTISYELLFPPDGSQGANYETIHSLNLSSNLHTFSRETIANIHQLFPNLKHLSIHTKDLRNVALCADLMGHLHSLKFKLYFPQSRRVRFTEKEYERKAWIYRIFHQTNLSFRTHEDMMTVWLGHDDLQTDVWANFGLTMDGIDNFSYDPRYGELFSTWMDYN